MSIHDFPIDDPVEEPRDSENTQDAQGSGSDPEDGGAPPEIASFNDRIAQLERRLEKSQENIVDLLAKNTALQTREKVEETKKRTAEELKKFGLEDDGKNQFDAAFHYTNQVRDEILEQVRNEYRGEKTQQFITEYMTELYPDLKDPDSEFAQKVKSEQKKLLKSGVVDPQSEGAENLAYNMALHRVGRTAGMENPADHSRERRISRSAAEGAPKRDPDLAKPKSHLTDSERDTMSRMGLDPSNKETVARFKKLQAQYSNARIS